MRVVDFHDCCDIMCERRRALASSHPLPLQNFTGKRTSLQDYLDQTGISKGRDLIVVSPFGHARSCALKTPTITTNPLRVGPHRHNAQAIPLALVERILGATGTFKYPENMSIAQNAVISLKLCRHGPWRTSVSSSTILLQKRNDRATTLYWATMS